MNMSKRYFLIAFLFSAFLQMNAQIDKQMTSFIDKLMSQMTLEEKIGQLNLPVSSSFVAGEKKDGEREKARRVSVSVRARKS